MMIVGAGDTAASVIGRLIGRHPITVGSRKTVEGTAAGILSTLASWWVVFAAVGMQVKASQCMQLIAFTVGAGLLEACTSQLDNIMIPLYYLAHTLTLTH